MSNAPYASRRLRALAAVIYSGASPSRHRSGCAQQVHWNGQIAPIIAIVPPTYDSSFDYRRRTFIVTNTSFLTTRQRGTDLSERGPRNDVGGVAP
jgi:hypothetical protein